jgi:mono/diheme cytochrome c family protein
MAKYQDRRLHKWGLLPLITGTMTLVLSVALPTYAAPGATQGAGAIESHQSLLNEYCITCHNAQARTGDLALDEMDLTQVPQDGPIWERVVRKVRGGLMPPASARRPEEAALNGLASYLETTLDQEASANPEPGRASLHRLNRAEYGNAIRDLLDLEVDVAELLPADDEAYGFDNIADVLRVSPLLLEQYLTASRSISELAVGDPESATISAVYRVPPNLSQIDHIEGLPLGTRGGTLIRHNFPLDAEYNFSVFLLRNVLGYMKGLEWPHQLEITIDGERVFLAPVGGDADNEMSDANFAAAAETIDERLKARIPVTAGPHDVGVTFIRKSYSESHEPLQNHTRDHDLQNMNGVPLVDYVDITGPFAVTGPGDTPSRRRIFTCNPASTDRQQQCAEQILSTLARRAYRRSIDDDDLDLIMSFFETGQNAGGFESGIQRGLRLILSSPEFLFRSEPDPEGIDPGGIYQLEDLALASRLSFFLWSSIPDDELLSLAIEGRLSDATVYQQQVRRMMADPKADAMVENFAGQWLFLRNLQSSSPDPLLFPNFDENLKQAFRTETELFFGSVMRDDQSLLDLISADYTFVNEKLARHYGINDVYGSNFRRVTIPDVNRRGLLGHGSVLTITSMPNRTSPVLRGKWILENILGTPPPAPPPDVPALDENEPGREARSVRERMEEHRSNPVCASCHTMIDPAGLALENFDAIGRWRTKEAGGVVDTAGQLVDGTPVDGPIALREALMDRSDQFVRTLTEKMLTYALGRGMEPYDMPVVRAITKDSSENDYRFSSLVMGIVNSMPFRSRRATGSANGIEGAVAAQ